MTDKDKRTKELLAVIDWAEKMRAHLGLKNNAEPGWYYFKEEFAEIRRRIEQGDEVEQLRVQLAGCLTAAEGHINPPNLANQGDYGWSVAYAAVLNLRRKFEELLKAKPK